MIPSPLGDYSPTEVLPQTVLDKTLSIKRFVVEETRTVRRYLSAAGLKGHIDELEFHELNEHTKDVEIEAYLNLFSDKDGNPVDVGLISEAGLPAVADPGSKLVALCHTHGIEVCPMVGPSSLMLALMGSGLNGQNFAFVGYLPAKVDERRKAIRDVEARSAKYRQTEIFIETPYRNDALLADLIRDLSPTTRLCVAANLTLEDQMIVTKSVRRWKESPVSIGKRPCVFLILAKQ